MHVFASGVAKTQTFLEIPYGPDNSSLLISRFRSSKDPPKSRISVGEIGRRSRAEPPSASHRGSRPDVGIRNETLNKYRLY